MTHAATIGKAIRQQRKKLGYTQEILAEKADITERTVSRIEASTTVPKKETLQAITRALKIPYDALFDRDELIKSHQFLYKNFSGNLDKINDLLGKFEQLDTHTVLQVLDKLSEMGNPLPHFLETQTVSVTLKLCANLRAMGLHWGLLHVSNMQNDTPADPLHNREITMETIDRQGTLHVAFECPINYGARFKLFVDHAGRTAEEVEALLLNIGMSQITVGGGKPDRLWFIHPDFCSHTYVDGLTNNVWYVA